MRRVGADARATAAARREAAVTEAAAFVVEVGLVREGRVYTEAVARGVAESVLDPASGIGVSQLMPFLRTLAGAYEIGEDTGLDALACAVERQLAETEGLATVTYSVTAGASAFEVDAFAGTSLYDVVERGSSRGAEVLREHIECACSGVMACSTCHVIVAPEWFDAVGPPCDAEQDMLDLAFEPEATSRLGCQLVLDEALDGLELRIPGGANNIMDDVPFEDR